MHDVLSFAIVLLEQHARPACWAMECSSTGPSYANFCFLVSAACRAITMLGWPTRAGQRWLTILASFVQCGKSLRLAHCLHYECSCVISTLLCLKHT